MCTYNGGRFLREQLSSIAKQSLLPDELVICDDGSTDTTSQIVLDFISVAPFEVRFIRNDIRLGTTRNFEKAVNLCRGRFIALADQDDVWRPAKLETLLGILESNPEVGGVFSDAHLINENSQQTGNRLWKTKHFSPGRETLSADQMADILLKENVVTGATMMVRADILHLLLPVGAHWLHDGWMAWMLVLYSQIGFVSIPLIDYRIHDQQQVGADTPSIGERLQRGRLAGGRHFVDFALQFEALRDCLSARPASHFPVRKAQFEGKIRHMYMRAQLSGNPVARGIRILRFSGDYKRYSRGISSMLRDLVI
jgi:glycosyltransferase involved in cell wall biosynthesis